MRVGQVLEAATQLLVARWRPLLALAVIFAGPAALLTAAAGMRFNEVALEVFPEIGDGLLQDAPMLTVAEFERLSGALGALGLATLVAGLLGSIGAVGVSAAALGPRLEGSAQLGHALRVTLRRAPSVVAWMAVTSAIVVGVVALGLALMLLSASLSGASLSRGGPGAFAVLVIGVTLAVLVVYLTLRWAIAYPLMAMEDVGWRAAMRRSWRLSADNVWRSAAIILMGALLTFIGTALLTQLASIVLVDVVAVGVGLDPRLAETLVMAAVTVFLAPVAPLLLAVLYVDLQARHPSAPPVDLQER